jgi:WhiB family redox-sensing transcriptional regulator
VHVGNTRSGMTSASSASSGCPAKSSLSQLLSTGPLSTRASAGEPAEAYVEIAASGAASWLAGALCAQTDPEVFFPEKGESALAALAVCRRCEVRAECLAWALEHNQRFGVWGGVTESDRRGMRRTLWRTSSEAPTSGAAA